MYVRICDSQTWRSESVAVLPFAVDFYIFLAPDAVRTWRFCTFPKTLRLPPLSTAATILVRDLTWPLLNSMPVAVGGCC